MAKLIIEECNQTSKVKVYHKIDEFPVTIGRSFNNTLISDDPYVSEVHLHIEKGDDEEQWLIRDCESENGCFLPDGSQITGETLLSSGDSICMGDSSFHFYTADHPVEAPLKWHPVPLWIKKVGQPLIAWSVFLLLVVAVSASEYFNSFEEFQMSKMAMAVIGVLFIVLLWAGIWSLVGKVVTHSPGFHRQLAILLLAMLLSELGTLIATYMEFFTSSRMVGLAVTFSLSTVMLAVTLYYSLSIATNMIKQRRAVAAAVVSTLFLIMVVAGQMAQKGAADNANPEFSSVIKSVSAAFLPATDPELFWKENMRLVKE